ncbi:DUF551 domain-containing protein [Opitutaceae bacterium TAV4]|nr:DUF551 domain-containing protein [Opitutaceae bacterium TAV4]RRK00767.1 DUF551 domain-containing protein [Opitutaceae bacterium TAV3]
MTTDKAIEIIRNYWTTDRIREPLHTPIETLILHVQRDGWIPVDEQLPAVDEQVLLYSENKYGVRQGSHDGGNRWRDCFDNSAGRVTHWKPLDPPNTNSTERVATP